MTDGLHNLDQWESAFERRIDRENKNCYRRVAVLRGSSRRSIRTVRDITDVGAGIRIQESPAVPLNFELSFDNFHGIRKCQLIWRDVNFIGVTFDAE
jgi:hypothetical protein